MQSDTTTDSKLPQTFSRSVNYSRRWLSNLRDAVNWCRSRRKQLQIQALTPQACSTQQGAWFVAGWALYIPETPTLLTQASTRATLSSHRTDVFSQWQMRRLESLISVLIKSCRVGGGCDNDGWCNGHHRCCHHDYAKPAISQVITAITVKLWAGGSAVHSAWRENQRMSKRSLCLQLGERDQRDITLRSEKWNSRQRLLQHTPQKSFCCAWRRSVLANPNPNLPLCPYVNIPSTVFASVPGYSLMSFYFAV